MLSCCLISSMKSITFGNHARGRFKMALQQSFYLHESLLLGSFRDEVLQQPVRLGSNVAEYFLSPTSLALK